MSRIETHKRTKGSMKWIMFGLFVSFTLISTSLFLLLYPFPSKEKVSYTDMEHPIIFNGELYHKEAFVQGDQIYLPLSFIKKEIDSDIIFDKKAKSIIITTKEKVLQLPNKRLQYFVNEKPINIEVPLLVEENGEKFLSLAPLSSIYPFQIELHTETGYITVVEDGKTHVIGTVDSIEDVDQLKLRVKPDVTTPYVASVKVDEKVFIEDEKENFYYVRKENGIAGYLNKNIVTLQEPKVTQIMQNKKDFPKTALQWPISLTWEAVYSKNPDPSQLPEMSGLNVVSPTWFSLKNGAGDIRNLASQEYVNWAKDHGYHIWALFSNDFEPERTHDALKDYDTRQKIIRQLVQYSEMYHLDGINVDFENINYEDRHLVTQFMKELTPYLHQAGLVVSMDVTFISESENWSKFYEREKLGSIVDYMMVMAYDEHWATSPVAGSVASLPWVEKNLKRLLKIVPNERVILGVPLYTRIWKEQETDAGNIEVSSKAHSMDYIQNWVKKHKLTPIFDEKTRQYYAEYYDEKEKATYKVWIEDETSMTKRIQLIHKYQLAGIASWSRFFASDDIWKSIDQSLQQFKPVQKEK